MAKHNEKIGPYTLISKLGRGAFGVVWLAEKRTRLATTRVALKLPSDDEIDIEAITSEARVWVEASGHPNVLPIIDADIYEGQAVIVSEYAPDGSLQKWIERHGNKAPSVEAAVEIMDGVLAGLEHLHDKRIVHRDLKPDNILLQREIPRLADFGIARILRTSLSTVVSGTPNYMAPEAFDGKRSEQTDLWAVGVIFYQLLVGSLPFASPDMTSLLAAILTREPNPIPASIPESLRIIVEKSLQKVPENRYKSASEFRRELRGAINSISQKQFDDQSVLPSTVGAVPAPQLQATLPASSAASVSTISAPSPPASMSDLLPSQPPAVLQDLLPRQLRPPPARSNTRLWLTLSIVALLFLCSISGVLGSILSAIFR